jgi:hypothetical protein
MLGYDHESFWKQTPRTLSLTFDAYNRKTIQDHNDKTAWLAYHIAGLIRTKKLPTYNSLKIADPTPRSMHRQLEQLKAFVIASGGRVIYKSKGNLDG